MYSYEIIRRSVSVILLIAVKMHVVDLQNDTCRQMLDADMHIKKFHHFKFAENRMILIIGEATGGDVRGKSLYLYDGKKDSLEDLSDCTQLADLQFASFSFLSENNDEYANGTGYKNDENISLLKLSYTSRTSGDGATPDAVFVYDPERKVLEELY